jgi:DNA-directed RNA polymerase alpha subunit
MNEGRLWELFVRIHEQAPASVNGVHQRVQLAYRILQEYEQEAALIKSREDARAGFSGMLVEDLDVGVRAYKCLKAENIFTVDELCKWSERRLLNVPNMGRKSLNEIKEELAKHGRQLAS